VVVFAVAIGLILLLCLALVIAVARDRGPGPEDTAVSYEYAWDRLDFDAVWSLSGTELRDGLDRKQFVAAKRAAYANQTALGELAVDVGIDDVAAGDDSAIVITRVVLHDGSTVGNRMQLARRHGRWQVVAYQLAANGNPSRSATE
jgi:hypothetical protein